MIPLSNNSEIEAYKHLLLEMASETSVTALLDLIVRGLGRITDMALARIWLIRPGDICHDCHMAGECPDRERCLHLVASAGKSKAGHHSWDTLNGFFRRFPIGIRKVGKIAATGEPFEVVDIKGDSQWIVHPQWVAQEGIAAYSGQPLKAGNTTLGVLSVFSRRALNAEMVPWLRLVANHAAISIMNAQTFADNTALRKQLNLENRFLKQEIEEVRSFGGIVGKSEAIRNIIKKIHLVAPTTANVLIMGESGTGKELIAREIHKLSPRRDRAMIRVNCASIPPDLYESEFFGHARGAFTGAVKPRAGRFGAAHQGTLFLDEVGEIPLTLQGKLLRVLQEGEYERVGEERTRQADARIIAATNRDLKREIQENQFREDLYFRLNVFPIEVPPLRQRPDDIPPLAAHLLRAIAQRSNCPPPVLTQKNIQDLKGYHWPGNVRELQNILERAMILSENGRLSIDLPGTPVQGRVPVPEARLTDKAVLSESRIREMERQNTQRALETCGWQIYGEKGAAALIGINPTTLIARMKRMGLKKPGVS